MNQTEGLIAQEQLERFVEQRVQSGVSVVVETVGRNGFVRSLVPTRSLQDFAREARSLSDGQEPDNGEDN